MYANGGRRIIPSSVKIDGMMILLLQLPSEEDDDTLSNADWMQSFVVVMLSSSSMFIFAIFCHYHHIQMKIKEEGSCSRDEETSSFSIEEQETYHFIFIS